MGSHSDLRIRRNLAEANTRQKILLSSLIRSKRNCLTSKNEISNVPLTVGLDGKGFSVPKAKILPLCDTPPRSSAADSVTEAGMGCGGNKGTRCFIQGCTQKRWQGRKRKACESFTATEYAGVTKLTDKHPL
ncbi:uncharacterized protein LOC144306156 isoform X3 [Canis aureus]